jgi:hypothetical protein
MSDLKKPTSIHAWLRDFKSMTGLPTVTAGTAKQMIYDLYPDEPWADEWGFSLWSAWCYIVRHKDEFEVERLLVRGKHKAIMLDALIYALYTPFLSCPKPDLLTVDFPVKEIAGKAHELLKKAPHDPRTRDANE